MGATLSKREFPINIDLRRFLRQTHGRFSCGGEFMTFADHTPKAVETPTLEDAHMLARGRLETVVVLGLHMGHRLQDLLEIGPLPLLGFAG